MRRLSILLTAVLLMGAGGKKPNIPGNAPDPETFEQRFLALGTSYSAAFVATNTNFSFRNFIGSTVGMCRWSSNGLNQIELSTSAWSRGSDTFREMLAFHEMGHCLLGRGHKNSTHASGRKESLMNSYLFDEKTYLANREAYLRELFTAENNRTFQVMSASKNFEGCGWH